MEMSQLLFINQLFHSIWSASKYQFLYLKGISCISFSAYCFLSCHWALLRKAWLCLLSSLPVGVWMHWQEPAWNSPSFLSLSSHLWYLKPLKIFMASCWALCSVSVSVLGCGAQNLTQHCRCDLTSAKCRGRIISLTLLTVLFLV